MLLTAIAACSPRVTVEAPKEPIRMVVDINIRHELFVKIDRELDTVIDENEDIF